MNWYLSKLSSNVSELRGNMTLKIPIDDSLGVSRKSFNVTLLDTV